ncbi:MAG: membrane-binding protein [Bacteroidota bacterium]
MKYVASAVLVFGLLTTACAEEKEITTAPTSEPIEISVEIPNRTVDKSLLSYNNRTSLWLLNDHPYSGYSVSYYPDSTQKEKVGILNGRRQNEAIRWYPDGQLKEVANYHQGKLHGEKKRWSSDTNHILVAQLNYHSGKAHGLQQQWYPTGELYKMLNLNMGREEGLQQAFRPNGALYANYEAVNGRIFGLKKAALCYGLEDENINYEN